MGGPAGPPTARRAPAAAPTGTRNPATAAPSRAARSNGARRDYDFEGSAEEIEGDDPQLRG